MSVIYLDHAASTPLCPEAKDAMRDALECIGNPSSAHSAGSAARLLLEKSRQAMANCLDCEPDELIFVSGGTEANALALHGRTRVAVGAAEHVSVLQNAHTAAVIPVTRHGVIDLRAAKPIIGKSAFVSVQYANNELGTIMPVQELGILCRESNAIFHTDAVQAVGHVPISLRGGPIDLMSMSAHKFGGPAGIGALFCRRGVWLDPLFRGGMQERGARAGTENVVAICGMAAALRASIGNMETENRRLHTLKDELHTRLKAIGGVPFENADALASHVHVMFPDCDAEALLYALDLHGICVSAGAACHSDRQEPSHVLLAVGMTEREANSCLRISMGRTTAPSDLHALCTTLAQLTKQKTQP